MHTYIHMHTYTHTCNNVVQSSVCIIANKILKLYTMLHTWICFCVSFFFPLLNEPSADWDSQLSATSLRRPCRCRSRTQTQLCPCTLHSSLSRFHHYRAESQPQIARTQPPVLYTTLWRAKEHNTQWAFCSDVCVCVCSNILANSFELQQ